MFKQMASEKNTQNHTEKHFLGVLGSFPPVLKKMRSNTAKKAMRVVPNETVLLGTFSFRKWFTADLEVQLVIALGHLGLNCVGRAPE